MVQIEELLASLTKEEREEEKEAERKLLDEEKGARERSETTKLAVNKLATVLQQEKDKVRETRRFALSLKKTDSEISHATLHIDCCEGQPGGRAL